MNKHFSIYIFVTVIFFGCEQSNKKTSEKEDIASNKSNHKDEEMYLLPGLNHGLLQSPINILTGEATEGRHNITLNFTGEISSVENLGHTVQLNFESGNTIALDDKTFEFKQLHFHTPSEHLIDGITYPMEMHVVNMLKDQPENETPEYLVIAFLIKMGKENKFMSRFIEQIPDEAEETRDINLNVVRESELFTSNQDPMETLNAHYFYRGSLTTPPYTESVNWYIIKKIFEASPEQILRINEIEGDNARHQQRKNERSVLTK